MDFWGDFAGEMLLILVLVIDVALADVMESWWKRSELCWLLLMKTVKLCSKKGGEVEERK